MIYIVLIGLAAGPFLVALIRDSIKVKKMEKELGKLERIEEIETKYGVTISEDTFRMN